MSAVALITGGSRGIGATLVAQFHGAGYRVAFCYLRAKEQANELARRYPGALPLRADVSDPGQVAAMMLEVARTMGPVDLLVNNAGVSHRALLTDTSDDDFDRLMGVNVRGTFLCCRAVLPAMVARKSGVILNISSMWGQSGASCEAVYSASKAAVIGLTQALAREVGPSGIRVNCIAPGVIDTEMNVALDALDRAALMEETPLGSLGTPHDVAQTALFLASDAARFITGQVIGVNGGFVM